MTPFFLLALLPMESFARTKLNTEGQYLPFPGITVVAPVDTETRARLKPFFEGLSNSLTVRRFCAPLPYESAHMTTLNLFTQGQKSDQEWAAFLKERKPFLKKMRSHLEKHAFKPSAKVKAVSFFSTGQFVMDVPADQDEKFRAVAKRFQSENTLPGKWHVTFCYFYKEVPPAEIPAFREELERITLQTLGSMQPNMSFEAPSIHTFENMQSYEPWRIDTFKWLRSLKGFFSKHPDPTPKDPAPQALNAPASTTPTGTSPPPPRDPAHAPDRELQAPQKQESSESTSANPEALHAIRE